MYYSEEAGYVVLNHALQFTVADPFRFVLLFLILGGVAATLVWFTVMAGVLFLSDL